MFVCSANTSTSFLVLFILFVVAIEFNESSKINIPETLFMVYGLGFALEKVAAMQEHGIKGEIFPIDMNSRN